MERDGVTLARRNSGGGAVYQDLGNSCFTFLSSAKGYDKNRNTEVIIRSLSHFGIKARPSGRNDILVGEKKISGSAYKLTSEKAFHHGTLLLNVDLTALDKYLSPNKAKLRSKGVDSVQARVINLKEINPQINHDSVCDAIVKEFFKMYDEECEIEELHNEKLKAIPSLKQSYEALKDWKWRFGMTPTFNFNIETRFDWGIMDVHINSKQGIILEVEIFSDTLFPLMIDELKYHLQGKQFSKEGVHAAINQAKDRFIGTDQEQCLQYLDEFATWFLDSI